MNHLQPTLGLSIRVPDWHGIRFVNEQVGYCWGARGVLKTENGGHSWRSLNFSILQTFPGSDPSLASRCPFDHPIFDLWFATPQIGWACSFDNLFATYDGGESWRVLYAAPAGYLLTQVHPDDAKSGWAMVNQEFEPGSPASSFLLRTSDAGAHWERQESDEGSHTENIVLPAHPLAGVVSRLEDDLLIIAVTGIHYSVDSGKTWTVVQPPLRGEFQLDYAAAIDRSNFWVTGSRHEAGVELYATNDAGKKWVKLYHSKKSGFLIPFLKSASTGFLIAAWENRSEVLMTTSGGRKWKSVHSHHCE